MPFGTIVPMITILTPSLMKILKTKVDEKTKEAFRQAAQSRGMSEAELLRFAINNVVDNDAETPFPFLVEPTPVGCELHQMTIRLPDFLIAEIKMRGERVGMVASRWVAALVQSNLMQNPVLTEKEIRTVQASNRELAAIGRNLNQIARALNINAESPNDLGEVLVKLKIEIDKNKEENFNLIKNSRGIWRIDDGCH